MGLPKEVAAFLLNHGERTRREVTRLVGREVHRVLSQVDWAREARRLMRGMRLQVRAEIQWAPVKRKKSRARAAATSAVPHKPVATTGAGKAKGPKA